PRGPFHKLYAAKQSRLYPFSLDLAGQPRTRPQARPEQPVQPSSHGHIEAGAHLADAAEAVSLLGGNDESAEVVVAGGDEADDRADQRLALLDLLPRIGPFPWQIRAVEALGHHALESA